MKCHWWRPEPDWPWTADAAEHLRGPRVRNFGDEITEFILKQMGITYPGATMLAQTIIRQSYYRLVLGGWPRNGVT
ncbi:MAG: hypothetical protein JWQ86_2508 [Mycobacterium sp.]|nr:hypothetical protein [Mycobacterium sp.]